MSTFLIILKAVASLGPLLIAFIRWYKDLSQESQKKFVADAHAVFSGLKQAQTKEEKYEAAHKIQDLIRRL